MAELADDPQVAELLLLLWDAPNRETGVAIVDLPVSLRKEELLTACEGAQLVRFAQRKHCWHGGGVHTKLVIESGWQIAELHKPDRKQAWQLLQDAIRDDVPNEIRHHVQLCYPGSVAAGRLALRRTRNADANQSFTALDRFPATPAGHVRFLEFVRDEVHNAAEAKRQQIARGYSNATLTSMVRGIKWTEARERIAGLTGLPFGVRANVIDVVQRELTVGTVEQIDSFLAPAVWGLRDSLERSRLVDLANKVVVVATAGDLWKAYAEGKRPCFQSSSISFLPGNNTPSIKCTNPTAESERIALDRAQAMVTAEGGDKAAAMEKLIARVQLQAEMDNSSVVNMPLADFVSAVTRGSRRHEDAARGGSSVAESRRTFEDEPDARVTTVSNQSTTSESDSASAKRVEPENLKEKLASVQAAERKAYHAFSTAELRAERRLEDREAYDLLEENGLPGNMNDCLELTDYTLPQFETWARQLRAARKALGEQKYTRRTGRPLSGSIAKAKELDHPS